MESGRFKAIFTRIKPINELVKCNLTNSAYIGTIFTCPGIARPKEKRKNRTFPVTVIIREMEYAAKVASNNVKKTEPSETITEFLNGVPTFPVANKVLKLFKLKAFGQARGLP